LTKSKKQLSEPTQPFLGAKKTWVLPAEADSTLLIDNIYCAYA